MRSERTSLIYATWKNKDAAVTTSLIKAGADIDAKVEPSVKGSPIFCYLL